MATPTVSRAHALVGRIARIDAKPARREAVALGLVDALLGCDDETLAAALDALREARARGSTRRAAVAQLRVLAGGPATRLRSGVRRRARGAPRGRPHP